MGIRKLQVIFIFSLFYIISSASCTRTSDCKDKHPIAEALSNPRALLDRYVPSFGTGSLRNRRQNGGKLLTIVSDEAEKNYALIADSQNRGNKGKYGNQEYNNQGGYGDNAGGVKNEGGYGGGSMPGYGNGEGGYGDGGSYPEPNPGYGGGGYDDPMIGHGNPSGGKGHKGSGGGGSGGYGSTEEDFGTGYDESAAGTAPENAGGYGPRTSGKGKYVIGENEKRIHVG